MHTWRLIHSGALSGSLNMALDEALFEAVANGTSPPVVRLYRWDPATVTLGYAQRSPDAVDFTACRELGFDVVRRSTGGRAVLHQHEITYALIAPVQHPLFAGGILESYRAIAMPLQRMLADLGVEAQLVPARHQARAEAHDICFTAPASYELAVQGRKIAGSAQKRNERAFLQHGSIPVDLDLGAMVRVLGKPDRVNSEEIAARLQEKIAWVNRYLKSAVDLDDVEAAMANAFRATLAGEWTFSAPSVDEWARAYELAREKFPSLGL